MAWLSLIPRDGVFSFSLDNLSRIQCGRGQQEKLSSKRFPDEEIMITAGFLVVSIFGRWQSVTVVILVRYAKSSSLQYQLFRMEL